MTNQETNTQALKRCSEAVERLADAFANLGKTFEVLTDLTVKLGKNIDVCRELKEKQKMNFIQHCRNYRKTNRV